MQVDEGRGEVIAQGDAGERSYNDIFVGQSVHIKLTSLPFEEFGILNGSVAEKTTINDDGSFSINISLPDGLKTSYDKEVKYYDNMSGQAEIILKDLRMIDRFLAF